MKRGLAAISAFIVVMVMQAVIQVGGVITSQGMEQAEVRRTDRYCDT
jgi:hypothetical protein